MCHSSQCSTSRYPGITSEQGNLQPCAWDYYYSSCSDVVGSVTDGTLGASTQFLTQNGGLTARRSWLFDESGVTSVVSHVGGTNASSVMTTVANQRLDGPVIVTFANGTSRTCLGNTTFFAADIVMVMHNHTVYQIAPTTTTVSVAFTADVNNGGLAVKHDVKRGGLIHIEAGPRAGDYSRISTHTKPVTVDMFRLSFEHTPTDPHAPPRGNLEGFAYSVLPDANEGAPPAASVWVSDVGHALSNKSSGAVAVALWNANGGTAPTTDVVGGTIRADGPCLLLLRRTDSSHVSLAVSWPEPNVTRVAVEIPIVLTSVTGTNCTLGREGSSRDTDERQDQGTASADTSSLVHVVLPGGDKVGTSVVCTLTLKVTE